jgi:hypothetical protein
VTVGFVSLFVFLVLPETQNTKLRNYCVKIQVLTCKLHLSCVSLLFNIQRLSESIQPFWISREPVVWPWCNLAANQRRPYCTSVNSRSLVGLVSRQLDAVDRTCVLCDRWIHNGCASRSASLRQCACPFYSSRAGFFGKASHHPGLSASLQPRFGSLRLLAFPKTKSPLKGRWYVALGTEVSIDKSIAMWQKVLRLLYRFSLLTNRKIY